MMPHLFLPIVVFALLLLSPSLPVLAQKPSQGVEDATASAKMLAQFFDLGRVVVGEWQAVINDPDKGNKGFTSAVFAQAVTQKFESASGIAWANLIDSAIPAQAKALLPQLLDVQRGVINDRQSLINLMGVGFKKFIPATFGTTVSLRVCLA